MKVFILGDGCLAETTRVCTDYLQKAYAPADADVLWVCYDTPIGEDNRPDAQFIIENVSKVVATIGPDTLVLISSQIPSGVVKKLETAFPLHSFAYSPENIRVAHAVADFKNQARIFVGVRNLDDRLDKIFNPLSPQVHYVTIETAEMIKHALNGFLALSVAYANELRELCKIQGANMDHVTFGLQSDPRIGKLSYLRAGGPYGAHLEREIYNLNEMATLPLISGIRESNEQHKAGR